MPRIIINDQYYYHIFNRGTEKRQIFMDKWDYVRFVESLSEELSAPSAPAGALGALSRQYEIFCQEGDMRRVKYLEKYDID